MTAIRLINCIGHNRWFVLWCTLILINSCSNIELQKKIIDEPTERSYSNIFLDVVLNHEADTTYVTDRFIMMIKKRGLNVSSSKVGSDTSIDTGLAIAVLKIEEIERRTETIVRYRQYGRTSLTMNHGREVHEKPVITLRATMSDYQSGKTIFQADYVVQGQWYDDDATVIASLAVTLIEQLEHEGFVSVVP